MHHCPASRSIKYFGLDAAAVVDEEHFNSWQVLEEVNSGEYLTDDYDFENPAWGPEDQAEKSTRVIRRMRGSATCGQVAT
jgi:uncharacterized protein involved in type VI secretion and phage assembly